MRKTVHAALVGAIKNLPFRQTAIAAIANTAAADPAKRKRNFIALSALVFLHIHYQSSIMSAFKRTDHDSFHKESLKKGVNNQHGQDTNEQHGCLERFRRYFIGDLGAIQLAARLG